MAPALSIIIFVLVWIVLHLVGNFYVTVSSMGKPERLVMEFMESVGVTSAIVALTWLCANLGNS